jgi:hypothetical protein
MLDGLWREGVGSLLSDTHAPAWLGKAAARLLCMDVRCEGLLKRVFYHRASASDRSEMHAAM